MSVTRHPLVVAGSNALLDGSAHTDTLAGAVVRGDLIYGNSTPKWARLAKPATRQVLVNDGTDVVWGDPTTGETTVTTTGTIDDLAVGTACVLRMNNATDSTIRGMVAGVAGQQVTIVSVGAGNVLLAHQNAGSSATNRLINDATSGNTPLAAGVGYAVYEYDGTTARWRLIQHEQGTWIAPAFSAGDFTAGGAQTWTVGAGDVFTYSYWLHGRSLFVTWYMALTTVGGTPDPALFIKVPGGFTVAQTSLQLMLYNENGTGNTVGFCQATASSTTILLEKLTGSWANSTDLLSQFGTIVANVT